MIPPSRSLPALVVAPALLVLAACGGSETSGTSTTTGSGGATTSGTTTGAGTGTGGQGSTGGPFTSRGSSSYEAQTSLAADAKGNVVAAWIAFFADNSSAIGYTVSRDGGATWAAPATIASPGGRLASNPTVAIDGQGRMALAWLGFRVTGADPDEHIYLSLLDAQSGAFGAPAIASDDGAATTRDFDKPALTVDGNDNLLLTWADFTGAAGGAKPSLTLARSVDGATFTRSTIVADDSFGNLAYLCVDRAAGPSAPLHVVHIGANGAIVLRDSTDQGKTWSQVAAPSVSAVFQDITCVAEGNAVWVAFAQGTALASATQNAPGDAVAVVKATSGTFGAPVVVSDGASGTQYLFPRLQRHATGKLEIAYYQGKDGAPATLTHAVSSDGAAWKTSALGNAGTFTIDRTLASWLGDTLGLGAGAGASLVAYTENGEGKAHIALAKVATP